MTAGRVVLVGFMGAGKSTVGRALAARLGWTFVDLDQLVRARAGGRTVADIFAAEGEPGFRARERDAAREAMAKERVVVAAGGGAFAQPDTRAILREASRTVWLRVDADVLLARIPLDGSRPLATNRERIVRLLAEREPFYRLADLTVDTSATTPAEVAAIIARALQPGEAGHER